MLFMNNNLIKTLMSFTLCFIGVYLLFGTVLKSRSNLTNDIDPAVIRPLSSEDMSSWSMTDLMGFLESSRMTNRSACSVFFAFGGEIHVDVLYRDGQKSVCLDSGVRPALNNCLVYSFGIDDEWSFDDDMARLGCEVYAFDPSMEATDHNRSARVHFYQMGIWHRNGLIVVDRKNPDAVWTVMTLSSIYKRFQSVHGDRPIDYLKIDVEGSEWDIIPEIVASGMLDRVKQLGIEIHMAYGAVSTDLVRSRVEMLRSLERDHGMIPFDYKINFSCKGHVVGAPEHYGCAEIAFFNSKYRNQSH